VGNQQNYGFGIARRKLKSESNIPWLPREKKWIDILLF